MPSWSLLEQLAFDIRLALDRGLALCRGFRNALTLDQRRTIAREVAQHLQRSNWRLERGAARPDHSTRNHMPPPDGPHNLE